MDPVAGRFRPRATTVARLRILSDAMRAFAVSTGDPEGLLQTVARHTAEALGGYCGFALVSSDGRWMQPVAVFDPDPETCRVISEIAVHAPVSLDAPHPFARAMSAPSPTVFTVTAELVRGRFERVEDQDAVLRLGLNTLVFVPLRAHGTLIGGFVIARHGTSTKPFDADDLELAQALADHAALAIANARTLARSQRLAERLRLLSELAQEFAHQVDDYQGLLALVARRVSEVVGDACVIRMLTDDGTRMETPGVIAHRDPDRLGALHAIMSRQPQQLGQGLSGRVAISGQTVLVPHVDPGQLGVDLGTDYRQALEELGMRSILVVALRANDVVIGTCGLFRTRPDLPYTDEDRYLLEDLATHASLAIANSRLLAASRHELADRLRTEAIRREVEERSRQMQEANRLKSEFLANMSHELRTPLNAVIGFAALMHSGKAGAISAVHKEYMGDILNSSRHLLQLINDILDLSKIEAGRMELCIETAELPRLVGEVRDIVRGIAAEKNIKLVLELDGAVTQVRVDPRLTKQVLYNYLSNALKFTPEAGRVVVRTRPAGDDAFQIEVEDTGIGICDQDLSRLFVEFQQLDQGSSKRHPGTGLGLALTKRIVEAQGGRVAVSSTVGCGSTFSAILPRAVNA
jgi:signal transduction histidine kinase